MNRYDFNITDKQRLYGRWYWNHRLADEYDWTYETMRGLHANGLTHKGALVKVLGRGELTRKVAVKAHAFSKSAEQAIRDAGGSVEVLPKPWGDRRPPAKGNQFANR